MVGANLHHANILIDFAHSFVSRCTCTRKNSASSPLRLSAAVSRCFSNRPTPQVGSINSESRAEAASMKSRDFQIWGHMIEFSMSKQKLDRLNGMALRQKAACECASPRMAAVALAEPHSAVQAGHIGLQAVGQVVNSLISQVKPNNRMSASRSGCRPVASVTRSKWRIWNGLRVLARWMGIAAAKQWRSGVDVSVSTALSVVGWHFDRMLFPATPRPQSAAA